MPKLTSNDTSLRDVLASYDRQVENVFRDTSATSTGKNRVQSMFKLRRSIVVHDSVLESALCPLLDELPGGAEIADALREGSRERSALLVQFQKLIRGTAAHNVYPTSGEEIEHILASLHDSFERHVHDETTAVRDVLEASVQSVDPEVVSARMAIEADGAPTRAHPSANPRMKSVRRLVDSYRDWNDTHHGWPSTGPQRPPVVWPGQPTRRQQPSIRELLADYDATVEALVEERREAETDQDRVVSTRRLCAAITVHDSVLGGVLCPLLDSVDDGRSLATRLRQGCQRRAELLQAWSSLAEGSSAHDLYRLHLSDVDKIIEPLIASFEEHASVETSDVTAFVEQLRERAWPVRGSGGGAGIWAGLNPEPSVLAAYMALWADHSPTRVHSLMAKHPSNRSLRTVYHYLDRLRHSSDR